MKIEKIENLDLNIYHNKLDNGLQVLVIPMKNVSGIFTTFSTKYGANQIEFIPINENEYHKFPLGIAHFLEHKLFEQENNIDPFSFFSERGANANANTNKEKTTYLFSGSEFFEQNLNYLLNYVQSPYFTDANVLKEKGIITQEAKMYLDDPDTVLYEKLVENVFINHPMQYPIIGTLDSIMEISKEDLYRCYNTFYHPSNMFLVVTGNVNPDEVFNIVAENQGNKKFEKLSKIKIKNYDEPNNVKLDYESFKANVSIPSMALGIKVKISSKNLYQQLIYISTYLDIVFGSTSSFYKKQVDKCVLNSSLMIDFINTNKHSLFLFAADTIYVDDLVKDIKTQLKNKIFNED